MSLAPLALALGLVVPQSGNAGQDGEALAQQVQTLEKRLAEVETYLQAQAKAAEAQAKALDSVAEEGFTAGANYKSRELLLESMHETAKAAQAKVPGVAEESDDDGKKSRRGR